MTPEIGERAVKELQAFTDERWINFDCWEPNKKFSKEKQLMRERLERERRLANMPRVLRGIAKAKPTGGTRTVLGPGGEGTRFGAPALKVIENVQHKFVKEKPPAEISIWD